jgi:virginiamycin B lyase
VVQLDGSDALRLDDGSDAVRCRSDEHGRHHELFDSPGSILFSIVAASDGYIWYTQQRAIRRITPGGNITTMLEDDYTLAGPGFGAMTAGTDDYLWFHNRSLGCVCRIHTDGTVATFPQTPPWITELAIGPDGNLWFTTGTMTLIGRMSPTGVFTTFPTATARPSHKIVAGPDGNMWFTQEGGIGVVALTPESQLEPSEIHLEPSTSVRSASHERSCYAT